MKRIIYTFTLAISFICLIFSASCSNSGAKNGTSQDEVQEQVEIDSLLDNAELFLGKVITIQGVCTHSCKHGAKKIFLMGSDDSKTIRVEAGSLGSFDTKCLKHVVSVTGILREERIDEEYLKRWEAAVERNGGEAHGNAESGCETEKKARGETASTTSDRIAAFREKIEQRIASEGKDYLSFYYFEASAYEIEE